jgi:hypothetical protein
MAKYKKTRPFQRPPLPPTALDATDAKIMVSEIDAAAAAVAGCYEQLTTPAQVCALRLGQSLSQLRGRLAEHLPS